MGGARESLSGTIFSKITRIYSWRAGASQPSCTAGSDSSNRIIGKRERPDQVVQLAAIFFIAEQEQANLVVQLEVIFLYVYI